MMLRFIVFFALIGAVLSSCPHEGGELRLFSDLFPSFDENSELVITEPVLLDLAEVEVSKLEISGDNGKLVFGRGIDISVTANGIFVKGNSALIIGSESCRHEDNVNIYLKGDRTEDRSSLGQDGDKYIAVQDNGILEIHGQDKLAWTKLDSTVERFDVDRSNIKYQHQASSFKDFRRWEEGLALYIFCHALEEKYFTVYDLWKRSVSAETDVMNTLISKLSEVKDNETVVLSIHNTLKVSDGTDLDPLWNYIEDLAGMSRGELLLRQNEEDDAFSLVFTKGGDYDQQLDKRVGKITSVARASVVRNDMVVSGMSKVTVGAYHHSSIDTRLLKQSVGFPQITVLDDISTWKEGDEILLTTTDYEFDHGEVRKIKSVSGKTIVLDHELEYRHFGEIEDGVDMRCEVALLTRNIKIEGIIGRECPDRNGNCKDFKIDTYGGHIKIIEGFGLVFIEGAELKHMGQPTDKGFYPIHFHMCRNITGKTAIVKRNSIHDTFQRAVVVHSTFGASEQNLGVEVIENVAYNIRGHAYFLEDGAELGTKFERNLGAQIRNVKNNFFWTDKSHATVFWITNPKTIMIGNVAAGSEGFGIWYTFPDDPVGQSQGLVYEHREASRTPLWTFDNNVVHSNKRAGMNFDNILRADGSVDGCMRYSPVVDPLDKKSDRVLVSLSRLTAYKNPSINTWIRGGGFLVIQYSSADSKRGLQLASGGQQQQFVTKSSFIGRSVGNREDDGYPDGTDGGDLDHYLGIVFYDGPVYIQDSYFNGFTSDVNNTWAAGALGFQPKNKMSSSVVSQVKNLKFGFSDGGLSNRVFDGNFDDEQLGFGNFDGDETATFRDIDGSVTTCDGHTSPGQLVQIVKPEKVLLTDRCKYKENWKMVGCQDHYGKLSMGMHETFGGEKVDDAGVIRRRRYDDAADMAFENSLALNTHEYMAILGSDTYYYEFQFVEGNVKKFGVTGKGIERDYHVVVGMCLPNGVTAEDLELYARHPNDHSFRSPGFTFVNSLEELKADTTMSRVFLDGRMIYIKMLSKRSRNPDWDAFDTDQCPGDWCPYFEVKILKSSVDAFTPCFTTTEEDLNTDVYLNEVTTETCTMSAKARDSDWGAGDTTAAHDGQWAEWSGWTECCNTPTTQSTRTRYRQCNNPTPINGGADCTGESDQSETCPFDCPVNGEFSQWSQWSDCYCDGIAEGTAGVKSRYRSCSASNGGTFCRGTLQDNYPCNGECQLD